MRDEPKDEVVSPENEPLTGPQDEPSTLPSPDDISNAQVEDSTSVDTTPAEQEEVAAPTQSEETTPIVDPSPASESAPVATAPVATEPAQYSTATPKKTKKPLIIGLIVAGVAALLIGGSALAYNYWYQNPEKVVTDAVINAITAKTVSATGTLELETDEYKLKLEASAKNSIEANAQMAVKLTFTADGTSFAVDGEGIYSADGDIYIKLNEAKKLAASIEEQSDGQLSLEVFAGVIEKIDSKWIKIGKEDLGDFSEDYQKSQQCVADISKQLDKDAAFLQKVEDETKALYKDNQFIIVGEKLGSRTINGQGSLGYKLSADPEIADAFFTGFGSTELGQRFAECDESIAFEDIVTDEAKQDDGTETEAEIWVSRFGHHITEVNLKANEDGTKGLIVVNPVFNQDQVVEIPADAIPLSELKSDIEKAYEEYFGSFSETSDELYTDEAEMTTEFN